MLGAQTQTHKCGYPVDIGYSLAVPIRWLASRPPAGHPVAVIVHLFYEELADEFRHYIENIPGAVDVFISTDRDYKKQHIENVFDQWSCGKIEVRIVPNRGKDIAPKLVAFRDVYRSYPVVLHLHSKKSVHTRSLMEWRTFLLEQLLGTPDVVSSVLQLFASVPSLGIVASAHFEPIVEHLSWGDNFGNAQELAARVGFELKPDRMLDFPSGSMFWARSAALGPLLDLELTPWDFPAEEGQRDGTLSHAIEHMYFHVCEYAGYEWVKIARPELFERSEGILGVARPDELSQFIADFGRRLGVRSRSESTEARQLGLSSERCATIDRGDRLSLLQELGRLYHKNSALLGEQHASHRANQDLAAQRAALASDREELISRRDELAGKCEELGTERDALLRERDDLAHSHQELATERNALLFERDELENQVKAITASKIWRLRKFLRTVRGFWHLHVSRRRRKFRSDSREG